MDRTQVIKELKAIMDAFKEERGAYPVCIEEAIRLLEMSYDDDVISRQAAIDYCYALINAENPSDPDDEWNYSQERINQTEVILHHLEFMPSAQPVVKDINVPVKDCISRQAAIDAILAVTGNTSVRELYEHVQEHGLSDMWSGGVNAAIDVIIAVPSAQPEQLTDKEQRIFLAAMGREEKVCKQVDDECRNCREPYEDSLVRTCHEITRKVKGALWT